MSEMRWNSRAEIGITTGINPPEWIKVTALREGLVNPVQWC